MKKKFFAFVVFLFCLSSLFAEKKVQQSRLESILNFSESENQFIRADFTSHPVTFSPISESDYFNGDFVLKPEKNADGTKIKGSFAEEAYISYQICNPGKTTIAVKLSGPLTCGTEILGYKMTLTKNDVSSVSISSSDDAGYKTLYEHDGTKDVANYDSWKIIIESDEWSIPSGDISDILFSALVTLEVVNQ